MKVTSTMTLFSLWGLLVMKRHWFGDGHVEVKKKIESGMGLFVEDNITRVKGTVPHAGVRLREMIAGVLTSQSDLSWHLFGECQGAHVN
ncbi:hypothetical protein KSS87_021844 [Heliosperma pusillum]|nr:hypothetical protein KSS87_021844 [Heliosperma pusillum]